MECLLEVAPESQFGPKGMKPETETYVQILSTEDCSLPL